MQKPRRERLKAVTEQKLVISHGKLFQTLITRSEKNTDRVALLQGRLNNGRVLLNLNLKKLE